MSKITEAIEKITEEVNKDGKEAIQTIGEYLIDTITEATAEKIMADTKTIHGSYKEIENLARRENGCVSDKKGFEVVEKYFGITPEDKKPGDRITANKPDPTSAPAQSMNIDLMDLL